LTVRLTWVNHFLPSAGYAEFEQVVPTTGAMTMKMRSMFVLTAAVMILASTSMAAIADDAAATPAADSAPMGHSPASKEHTMMNRAPASSAPASEASPDNGMGHSPASKEHQMMNHHHPKGGKSEKSGDGKMNMMGHSPASKEHTQMKQKPADETKPSP
jgi:hypothetical protein